MKEEEILVLVMNWDFALYFNVEEEVKREVWMF